MDFKFYYYAGNLLVLLQYVALVAEAKSNLVLYSLSSSQAPLHLSNVILEASFAFEEVWVVMPKIILECMYSTHWGLAEGACALSAIPKLHSWGQGALTH